MDNLKVLFAAAVGLSLVSCDRRHDPRGSTVGPGPQVASLSSVGRWSFGMAPSAAGRVPVAIADDGLSGQEFRSARVLVLDGDGGTVTRVQLACPVGIISVSTETYGFPAGRSPSSVPPVDIRPVGRKACASSGISPSGLDAVVARLRSLRDQSALSDASVSAVLAGIAARRAARQSR